MVTTGYLFCKLVGSKRLLFCVATAVYFVLYLWHQIFAWRHIYTVSVEFPNPDKIDIFTYMTETERPNALVQVNVNLPLPVGQYRLTKSIKVLGRNEGHVYLC